MNHGVHYPRKDLVLTASVDFYFLQNRCYPRNQSLEMVGNRYSLTKPERDILKRSVFSQQDALARLGKRVNNFYRKPLTIDGHNVHITVESFILGRLIVKGNDGALRDIAEISSGFKLTEVSLFAAELICQFLRRFEVSEVMAYFDSPISKSGELARTYNELFRKYDIKGKALAVPVPERNFSYKESIIASSDSAVISEADKWIDLPSLVINERKRFKPFVDFSFLRNISQVVDFSMDL